MAGEGGGGDEPGKEFRPEDLDRSLIALPLLREIGRRGDDHLFNVIIDLNLECHVGRDEARRVAKELVAQVQPGGLDEIKSDLIDNYLFAEMSGADVKRLAQLVQENARGKPPRTGRVVHRIWLDEKLKLLTNASVAIIKGNAAHNAFSALGEGIVWAVCDSGIDASHPHFRTHRTLDLPSPLGHLDVSIAYRGDDARAKAEKAALRDVNGHGTHVAGIIAGELLRKEPGPQPVLTPEMADKGPGPTPEVRIRARTRYRDEDENVHTEEITGIERMSGVAPKAKLLSIKVLDDAGSGLSSNLIVAIAHIQKMNNDGRRLRVHGVNMSVGYDFDPQWFACGQSPLCVEVNRLVKSGVSVVVAAGNTGYGWVQLTANTARTAGLDLTINDPGNAELAITVGSTHRDMPHIYGVSYFSSKGPTGDGRLKPDLVAPGEKILSCHSAQMLPAPPGEPPRQDGVEVRTGHYREDSGTSMAAPHVSGAIAAFLSVRKEFIGRPEEVKQVFMDAATDLKRDRHFQGAGLLDLMRALQAV